MKDLKDQPSWWGLEKAPLKKLSFIEEIREMMSEIRELVERLIWWN